MEGAPMRTDLTPETTRFENVRAQLEALGARQGAELRNTPRFGIIPPAEKILVQFLLDLQALPDRERAGADILMDRVAEVYLSTSDTSETRLRRIHHLLLISHVGDANESSN
jgi:hypothetical protein